jgi:hypothetical protein
VRNAAPAQIPKVTASTVPSASGGKFARKRKKGDATHEALLPLDMTPQELYRLKVKRFQRELG